MRTLTRAERFPSTPWGGAQTSLSQTGDVVKTTVKIRTEAPYLHLLCVSRLKSTQHLQFDVCDSISGLAALILASEAREVSQEAKQQFQHWGQVTQEAGDPPRTGHPQAWIPSFPPARDATSLQTFLSLFFLPIVPAMVAKGSVTRSQSNLLTGFVGMGKSFHFPESVSWLMGWDGSVLSTIDKTL